MTLSERFVSNKNIEHEIMRFNSMTDRKLQIRLGKITKPEKLYAFIMTSRTLGKNNLTELAYRRAGDLGYKVKDKVVTVDKVREVNEKFKKTTLKIKEVKETFIDITIEKRAIML